MTPKLPPLPEPDLLAKDTYTGEEVRGFTIEDMQDRDAMWAERLAALAQQAQEPVANERECPHCNYTGSMHCGDVAEKYGGILNPKDCSHAKLFGSRAATPQPQPAPLATYAPNDTLPPKGESVTKLAPEIKSAGCGLPDLRGAAPQAGDVTDEQIDALIKKHSRNLYSSSQLDWEVAEFHRFGLLQLIRAILALRPQAVPMTPEQIVQGQEQQGAQSILSFMKGVRFVEAHRGITAKAEGASNA